MCVYLKIWVPEACLDYPDSPDSNANFQNPGAYILPIQRLRLLNLAVIGIEHVNQIWS